MEDGECCVSDFGEREMGQLVVCGQVVSAVCCGHMPRCIARRVAVPDRPLLVLDATPRVVHNCYLLF